MVFAGIDPLTRRKRYLRATCKTRAEAEKELTRLQRDVDQDKHPKSAITVSEAVAQWMEVAELEETTRDRYEDLIRLYILPIFGGMPLSRIDAELLERYYARLHRCKHLCPARPPKGHVHKPLSSSTTRKIHYILRGSIERAVRWGYIGVNAAAMAYAPTPAKTRPDPPSTAEAAALLNDAWREPEWGLLLWLTMVTGCRRGELCSIRWRHIDFDRADIWIERATAQTRAGILEKAPKSGDGRRVSLDPHTLELLRKHRVDVTEELFKLGVRISGDTFVFSTTPDYSQPRKPRSVTQKYRGIAHPTEDAQHPATRPAPLLRDRAAGRRRGPGGWGAERVEQPAGRGCGSCRVDGAVVAAPASDCAGGAGGDDEPAPGGSVASSRRWQASGLEEAQITWPARVR
jgi:integrase